MNSCPYCAQTDTQKDKFGYCKKHSCFEVSGTKKQLEDLKKELSDTILLPKYKRNFLDGTVYNPQKEKRAHVLNQIQKLIGFVPLEVL